MNTNDLKILDEHFHKQLVGAKNNIPEINIEQNQLNQYKVDELEKKSTISPAIDSSMQLQSDAYLEFVNIHPSFIEKWGLLSITFLVIILILFSYLIPYPEKVQCEVKIHSENAPKELRSKLSSKILKVLKKNEDQVVKNEPIILIESTADHHEIQIVYDELKVAEQYLRNGNEHELQRLFLKKHSQLGELQNAYQLFYQELLEFKDVHQDGYYQSKKAYMAQDINQSNKQKKVLALQQTLAKQQFNLVKEKYNRYKILYDQKVISKQELEQEQILYLSKKSDLEQFQISAANSEEQVFQKQKEMLDIKHEMSRRGRNLYEALLTLISDFEQWNSEHIITSPTDGFIQFNSFLEAGQTLQVNQTFAQVVSENETSYYAELKIHSSLIEKVAVGKKVLLSFDGYNYSDYGFVEAKIVYISRLPIDSSYIGRAEIEKNFKSKSHKIIPLKHNMHGFGNVIISDASILERVCKDLWNKVHE